MHKLNFHLTNFWDDNRFTNIFKSQIHQPMMPELSSIAIAPTVTRTQVSRCLPVVKLVVKLSLLSWVSSYSAMSWASPQVSANTNINPKADVPVLVKHTNELDLDTEQQLTPLAAPTKTTTSAPSSPNAPTVNTNIIPVSIYQQAQAGDYLASNNSASPLINNSGYNPNFVAKTYQDKAIKVIKFHHNYPIVVALNQLNYLQFPFQSLQVDTVANIKLIARGSTLMFAPNQATPFTLLVSNKDNPQEQVTLTVIPNAIPSVSFNFIAPQLLTKQTLLGKSNLTYDELIHSVSNLLRYLAQKIYTHNRVGYGLKASYVLENFKFKSSLDDHLDAPSELELVNISNPSLDAKYPLVTCAMSSFKVLRIKTYQPTNFYFNGIRLRYVQLQNKSNFTVEYNPQDCLQSNVISASLLSSQPRILPGQIVNLVLAEKVDY